jgi:hypothetical protein
MPPGGGGKVFGWVEKHDVLVTTTVIFRVFCIGHGKT